MGTVYRAHDRELDEEVALKTLRLALAASPAALGRFRREVKLARRVTHPNVVRTYDLGVHEALHFLTMELLDGPSLDAHAGGALALADALRLAGEIARGLAAAHAVGVVHRDLKPQNVIVAGPRVAISDFGIARIADGLAGARAIFATAGGIVGTPAYMAPEQVEASEVDGRADVYALGVLLFQLLTGALPFPQEAPMAQAAARLSTAPRDPRSLAPGVPDAVAALVLAMLERNRAARPDAQTVLDRIDRVLCGAPAERSFGSTTGDGATLSLDASLPAAATALAVRDFDAGRAPPGSALGGLAVDLAGALRDALARGEVTSVYGRLCDAARASVVCEASLRLQDDERTRVRMRLVDRAGATLWAERIDGSVQQPLDLEDAVVEAFVAALRARADTSFGPAAPELRARYDAARLDTEAMGDLVRVRAGIARLEELHIEAPDDPWVASLLATSLCRVERMLAGSDAALFARAEDLALRALASPASPPLAHHAMALVRSSYADHRACLRAEMEALRRAPRLPEAHLLLGRLLCQLGRVAEGMARLRLAVRLHPGSIEAHLQLATNHALLGDRKACDESLGRAEGLLGRPMLPLRVRLPFILCERELAGDAARMLRDAGATGATWESALPALEAYARGEPAPAAPALFAKLTDERVAPYLRALLQQVACEYYAAIGDLPHALETLAEGAANDGFVDLLWLDRTPSLALLRGEPVFARARALIAARVAQITGA